MGSNPDSEVHGAHLGQTRPKWGPCWPHEYCYLGSSTDKVEICIKEDISKWFWLCPNLKQLQWCYSLRMALKVSDMPSSIAMIAHYCDMLSHICAIWHFVIGQERDRVWAAWLNWRAWPWVAEFGIHFSNILKILDSRIALHLPVTIQKWIVFDVTVIPRTLHAYLAWLYCKSSFHTRNMNSSIWTQIRCFDNSIVCVNINYPSDEITPMLITCWWHG